MRPSRPLLLLAAASSVLLAGCVSEEESTGGSQPGEEQACPGVDTGGAPVPTGPDEAAGERDCPAERGSTSGVPGVTSPGNRSGE